MFLPYHQNQNFLFPRSLSDFIPADHEARIISDILDQMDLASFYGRYSAMGPPAYHPKMVLKVILYGFLQGIFSSRKLARACEESLPFLYLSGMQTPVYRTFIEFRERHRAEMEGVFKETVRLARAMGLARLGEVALDVTKVLADTSQHKAMSYGRMKEMERTIQSGKSIFPAIWRNSAIGSTGGSNWKTSFHGLCRLRLEPRPFPTGWQYWLRIMGNQVRFC